MTPRTTQTPAPRSAHIPPTHSPEYWAEFRAARVKAALSKLTPEQKEKYATLDESQKRYIIENGGQWPPSAPRVVNETKRALGAMGGASRRKPMAILELLTYFDREELSITDIYDRAPWGCSRDSIKDACINAVAQKILISSQRGRVVFYRKVDGLDVAMKKIYL